MVIHTVLLSNYIYKCLLSNSRKQCDRFKNFNIFLKHENIHGYLLSMFDTEIIHHYTLVPCLILDWFSALSDWLWLLLITLSFNPVLVGRADGTHVSG